MEYNNLQKEASEITRKKNKEIRQALNNEYRKIELEDLEDFEKHLIYKFGDEDLKNEAGDSIWPRQNQKSLTDLDYPETVNPLLWDNFRNGYLAGVVKYAEGFYSVTGLDSSPIGFIRSKNGWIIQDCGNTVAAAEISIKTVEKVIGEKIKGNVKAIIYSHTHTDHIAGVAAFVSEGEKIPIYAPASFGQSLVDDNLYAGRAMSRRLMYQCGLYLKQDVKQRLSIGLASSMGVHGGVSFIYPDHLVEGDQTVEIDGISLTFLQAPETETRAHMMTYFNDYDVLFLGDVGVGTIHNTYTMRGAPVRDANYWGKVFFKLFSLYGDKVKAIYQGHGIPHFFMDDRPDNLKKYLLDNAAAYKYTHDEALLLANKGYSINRIGHDIRIPDSISNTWYTRGFYGSYSFNARGVVQKYLGFYNGNPINLLPLKEQELGRKFVEYIGSEELVLEKASADFEKGEYQWVATITNYIVFLNPKNLDARYLCADALEQLGYQQQNALWRNAYLAAAVDLRHPEIAESLNIRAMSNSEVIPYAPVELIIDHLGINFDGFAGQDITSDFTIRVKTEDEDEAHRIYVYKGTIFHEKVKASEKDYLLTKNQLYRIATKELSAKEEQDLPKGLKDIYDNVVDTFEYRNFHLVEPN